jgi:hypothetical protein
VPAFGTDPQRGDARSAKTLPGPVSIRVIAPPRHAVRETGGHLTDEDVLNALS